MTCITSPAIAQNELTSPSFQQQSQNEVTEVHFTEHSSSSLQGKWWFYPNQFIIQPSSILQSKTVQLPASFKTLAGSNAGYGTFIGHFKIPKEFLGRRIAIRIPTQYGAYRMYVNGQFIVRLGEISTTPEKQVTEKAPRIGYFVPDTEYITLSIQASNYTHLHGGLERPMQIGIAATSNRQFQQLMMSIAMVCGAVFGVGVFTILFSIFRGSRERNSKSIFVFGWFIVFLAMHNLFSAPYAYSVFTNINWLWGSRLEYLFTFFAAFFFLSYMHLFNRRYLNPVIYYIAVILLVFNIIITLFSSPEIFERLALFSAIYALVILANFMYGFYQTLRYKEHYSRLNLIAIIFLCLTFLNDYLLLINVIKTTHLFFISTSIYALLIMFRQSRHYAHQTYETEQLNLNLIALNNSLDQKVKERTQQLHELNAKLEQQMNTDALTGAFNRRALNHEIQQQFLQTRQQPQHTLVFAMLDVDYFKNYNDYYGHLKGDDVLKNLVRIIQQALPPSGYLARYGGEEFAILLTGMPVQTALKNLENVLEQIREQRMEHLNRPDAKKYITVSMGAAWTAQTHVYADIHELMKAADVQLYAAKQAGRDQLKIKKETD
ncbi:diguanylate cyclase domain-containing protein [Acinetobacter sp. 197]|uniref:sensor domain-containing diguanylate cyclase n=1 Tax=Acinetobacter sp. 197 TaxID=3114696 RepID=UPI003A897EB6